MGNNSYNKITDLLNIGNTQVSKRFITDKKFIQEAKNYRDMLQYYKESIIPDYFNIPLKFGKIFIGQMENRSDIYTDEWYNGTKDKIMSEYQITFMKGNSITSISLNYFYSNYMLKLLYAVKYLLDKNLIFDDLKLDNMALFKDNVKFIDFSGIYKYNDLKENYNNSILKICFYNIYYPVFNILLTYYLTDEAERDMNELHKKIKKLKMNKKNSIVYIDIKIDIIIKVFNFMKNINPLAEFNIDGNFININDIQKYIIGMPSLNFCNTLKKYLDKKHKGDINDINKINELLQRITIYSLGYTIFTLLSIRPLSELSIYKLTFIINFACQCCCQFYIKDRIGYFTKVPNINNLISLCEENLNYTIITTNKRKLFNNININININ